MKIVDANIILRYLLDDIDELAENAAEILENFPYHKVKNYEVYTFDKKLKKLLEK
ncbi:hypothetical protein [Caldanaerobacter sp.]|uniref:hypothetical protein n=1 Tax=Caldanaerobacter sp. TaxID=2930036 RepID=UPI003C78D569